MLRYASRNTLLLRRSEIHLPAVGEILGSESESSISDAEGDSISKVFQQYFYLISTVFP